MRLGRCWSLLLALHVQTGGRTTGTSGIGKDMQQFKNKCCEIEREVFFYKKNRFWGMYKNMLADLNTHGGKDVPCVGTVHQG